MDADGEPGSELPPTPGASGTPKRRPRGGASDTPRSVPPTPSSVAGYNDHAPGTPSSQVAPTSPRSVRSSRPYGQPGTPSSRPGTPGSAFSRRRAPGTPGTPGSAFSRRSRMPLTPGSAVSRRSAPGTPGSQTSVMSHRSHVSHRSAGVSSIGGSGDMEQAVIWGTKVSVDDAMRRFRYFLNHFVEPNSGKEPYYLRRLKEIRSCDSYNLNINCEHLYSFARTRELYSQLVHYPQELIPIMDLVVHQEFLQLEEDHEAMSEQPHAERDPERRIQVRTFNLRPEHQKKMRSLDPTDIDQMVAIKGMVIRCSPVIPDLKAAFFRCLLCHHTTEVNIDRGRIDEPTSCENCRAKHSFEVVHNRCLFADKQMIKLQENPEHIPEGETPQAISLFCFDDLVDVARPGDKVEVTGIFRAVPMRVNPRKRTLRSVYRTYLDVLHFKKSENGRLRCEDASSAEGSEWHTTFEEGNETNALLEKKQREIEEMSRDPDIYENLTKSLAPSIWEMDDVKKGVLCQLFGGADKKLATGKTRGEINVLLCGDPGTSKSQMLGYVHKIAPRGIYTSGKGSSAVGLTAYVMKDPETKELVLESGALVLSDRGVCCIDEFDKMSESTRSVLHEAMEQQTVSIAKAGIICTLNARTSILASANPIESRYNPNMSVVQNLQLPPTLLSRFDLIYLVLDHPNQATDRRLAKHLVSLYYQDPMRNRAQAPYTPEQVSEYISYAKQHVNPVISDEAGIELIEGYKDLRRSGMGGAKKVVAATPRQLESLIRLSEAVAKIRFSQSVTAADVKEAIRLMNVATQKAATDPRTGRIDMDMITTGQSAATRESLSQLQTAVSEILKRVNQPMRVDQIMASVKEQSDVEVPESNLVEVLRRLRDENLVKFNEAKREVRLV